MSRSNTKNIEETLIGNTLVFQALNQPPLAFAERSCQYQTIQSSSHKILYFCITGKKPDSIYSSNYSLLPTTQ